MSKEATGENGAILGSSEYWDRVNRATFFGRLMRNASETNYQETLREVGHRAGSAVEEIYDDLQNHIKSVRAISSDRRSSLAKQVQGLYDVCSMAGGFCSHSSDCIGILNLSSFYLPSTSFGDDRAIQNAIHKIKNCPDFFASECIDLVRQAADWSISFAAGSDARKSAFLKDVSQGKGREFLRDVLNAYYSSSETADLRGNCGYSIGSREYRNYIERKVFLQDLPAMSSDDYDEALRDSLTHIANQLQRDLARNERENNYITDETARKLRDAANELGRCGVSVGFADSSIERLNWFVGGDANKIRQLQQKLNELALGERLEEDGVYGEKTLRVWSKFLRDLEHGTVPTLCWIDVLQKNRTGIEIGSTTKGAEAGLNNAFKHNGHPYIRFDPPHNGRTGWFRGTKKPIDYNHVNFDKMPDSNWLYDQIQSRYNHYPLSDAAYDVLKDLKNTGRKVRIAGRVLLVGGIALDVLELGTAVNADLKDADRKLGKTTALTAASIGGSWAGGALGAKAGALLGTLAGPAAPVAIPILSIAGGIGGAFGGDKLAQWVIDITDVED